MKIDITKECRTSGSLTIICPNCRKLYTTLYSITEKGKVLFLCKKCLNPKKRLSRKVKSRAKSVLNVIVGSMARGGKKSKPVCIAKGIYPGSWPYEK